MAKSYAGDYTDLPQISTSLYGSTTLLNPAVMTSGDPTEMPPFWAGSPEQAQAVEKALGRSIWQHQLHRPFTQHDPSPTPNPGPTPMSQSTTNGTGRRVVQVFIADPHPDVPMDKALLYKGEPTFTDSTDQELYFELPVAALLARHNEQRVLLLDKEATRKSGREVRLEPARVRDLKMAVVVIAQF